MQYEYIDELFPEGRNMEVPPCDTEPHLLIASVRESYLKYMTKVLCENYVGWCGERPPKDVVRAARDMELKAAARAMLVPLYRVSILTMIKSVRKYTSHKDLFPEVEDYCIKSRSKNKATQTEITSVLQHSKIENIPNQKAKDESSSIFDMDKMAVSTDVVNSSSMMIQDSIIDHNEGIYSNQDSLKIEIEKLLQDDHSDSDNDIFTFMGDNDIYSEQTEQLINEPIEKLPSASLENINETPMLNIFPAVSEGNFSTKGSPLSLEKRIADIMKPVGCSKVSSTQPLTAVAECSRWPCELYFQKQKLRIKLDMISEKNFKLHVKIKERFLSLFGYDSCDEQALQSPDTSDGFRRSCRQRAAPMVLRHLASYVAKGRLARQLCKPLTRHLLYLLVNVNQYPSDYECFLFVKEYFHHRTRIRCRADF